MWEPEYGDRRQEIVFIGIEMEEESIKKELDRALLTDAEMQAGPSTWADFPDPFVQMFPERMEPVEK